jgi:hypothetical protein
MGGSFRDLSCWTAGGRLSTLWSVPRSNTLDGSWPGSGWRRAQRFVTGPVFGCQRHLLDTFVHYLRFLKAMYLQF